MTKIDEKTKEFILKEDNKLNKIFGYKANDLKTYVENLLNFGHVEVGYRNSCGSTDPTLKTWRSWIKALSKLRKNGISITEESVKHKNSWATKSQGFWNSTIYKL
jgi:hypothetical protein